MRDDLRIALRLLLKDKGFTLTAGLTLALCIGAHTALFSVVHGVLLEPLPVPESDRILLMANSYPKAGAGDIGESGVPDYFDRLRALDVFEVQAMMRARTASVDQGGAPTRLHLQAVTPSFFPLVRTAPVLGRAFTDAEGEIGGEKKAILSYATWQSMTGGDPAVLGRDIRLDGEPYTVVGVMPRGFLFTDPDATIWVPLAFTAEQKADSARHSNNWEHVGRLKPGRTVSEAQAQIDALNAANLDRFPQYRQLLIDAGFHTVVVPLRDHLVRHVRSMLGLLWGGALSVLLIGGVNVASLVLGRSRARARELATRLALGAGPLSLARQLATEGILLTVASAVAGLGIGAAALRLFAPLALQDLPRGGEVGVDAAVVTWTIGAAVLMGALLGVVPMLGVRTGRLTGVLRDEGRTGTGGRGARAMRRGLVVAQVAFALVLLVGGGLLLASLRRILSIDPGFRPPGVLTASIELPRARYADEAAIRTFVGEALARLRRLPGVSTAGATDTIPFGGNHSDSVILAEGRHMSPGESVISPARIVATPGYFEAMGATLRSGRFFEERDKETAPRVAIVDQRLARRFWPGQDPIGRRFYEPTDINNLLAISDKTVFLTVVGVVGDMKIATLTEGKDLVGTYYYPLAQAPERGLTFALRTGGDEAAIAGGVRATLQGLDAEMPVFDAESLSARTARSLRAHEAPVFLAIGFGALALFLSAVGVYGVLAYLVAQRTREMAIRIALGGSARAIFALVLREGLLMIGGGFLLGASGAVALRRALESQLYGTSATDPAVLAGTSALLLLVAFAACALPARRATRVDPVLALAE